LTRVTRWNPPGVAAPVGRYSHAVATETGDAVWIHVAGQIAVDAEGTLVGAGDLGAQTERVFENLRAILEAHGATFEDVVRIDSYLTTFDGLDAMREVRNRYTSDPPPASTLIQIVALVVPGALIEVDLVAVIPAERFTRGAGA
jgi:enamine deaminase RidA (YjgF/YER057c/UK114 family)